jgi:two-component system chemotaxis response regulator CheB
MSKPRVLIVDDSVVVRRLVSKALEQDGLVEIAGVAADGRIALTKISQDTPDLVVLDVEMPVMDGLTALVEIRKRWPRLPVIVFSTLTVRGAEITLEALARGASDYVPKPSRGVDPADNLARIRDELVPRIFALCPSVADRRRLEGIRPTARPLMPRIPAAPRTEPRARVDVVAIGVSTGGPTALARLLPALPETLPVPIVIVQHMPPLFTGFLAERLDRQSALRVAEARNGDPLEPGGVLIAPGDRHMVVEPRAEGSQVRIHRGRPENSCRPSVDPLFRSVADTFGSSALAVVLTGMGSDGLRGAERVREVGGRVLVQDEASSVVWGMPGFVARAGLADAVIPIEDMARELLGRVGVARPRLRLAQGAAT